MSESQRPMTVIELDDDVEEMILILCANEETNPLKLTPEEYFRRLVKTWLVFDPDIEEL